MVMPHSGGYPHAKFEGYLLLFKFGPHTKSGLTIPQCVRPFSPLTGTAQRMAGMAGETAATAATAAADDSIDKGWTTGRRTDADGTRAVLALPGCRKLFKSPSPAPLPRSLKDVFARRCRVRDKLRSLGRYHGVLYDP